MAQIKRVPLGVTAHFAPRLPFVALFSSPARTSVVGAAAPTNAVSSTPHAHVDNSLHANATGFFRAFLSTQSAAAPDPASSISKNSTGLMPTTTAASSSGAAASSSAGVHGQPPLAEAFVGARVAAELYVDDGDEEDTAGLAIKVPQSPSSAGVAAALSRMSAYDLDPMCTDGRMLLVFFPGARAYISPVAILFYLRGVDMLFEHLGLHLLAVKEFRSCFLSIPDSFLSGDSHPAVYFQDLSCRLHFVAASVSEYYCLMLVHLGICHWQYAFSQVGLPSATQV